jgi:hypothetical protein
MGGTATREWEWKQANRMMLGDVGDDRRCMQLSHGDSLLEEKG